MTLHGPEPLDANHRLEGFDCGKATLNDWLVRYARQAQAIGSAKTFVVTLQDAIRRTLTIAEQAGIRALLTHPIDDDAARFYRRFGFIASPLAEQQLLLLLEDVRRLVK